MAEDTLHARVEHAIDRVLDPCSRLNGTNLSFLEMGMVDSIDVREGGDVLIKLFLDDPTCVYFSMIRREMRDAVLAVPGVQQVELELVFDRIWTEDDLHQRGREKLAAVRAARRDRPELIQIGSLTRRSESHPVSSVIPLDPV